MCRKSSENRFFLSVLIMMFTLFCLIELVDSAYGAQYGSGRFVSPQKNGIFIKGINQEVKWQMPNGDTYYNIEIELLDSQDLKIGNIIEWNWVKYKPISSVNWDFKTIYNLSPVGRTAEGRLLLMLKIDNSVQITSGKYKLRLTYSYSEGEKLQGSFKSDEFEIKN